MSALRFSAFGCKRLRFCRDPPELSFPSFGVHNPPADLKGGSDALPYPCCRRDRIDMSFRRGIPAVAYVTLSALKSRISFFLLELEIQNSVRRRFDVAASARASTRLRLSSRLRIERVERRDVVTTDATQARVRNPFVAELRGVAPAPLLEHHLVLDTHR